jgi:hypothetical protein
VKNEWLTARALGKLIKPILFSKDKLNEETPQPLRNLQAIVDFEETKNIQNGIQKLIASLKKINSFTCDYNYNILPVKREIPFLPNADFVDRTEDLLNLYLEVLDDLNMFNYSKVGLVGIGGVGKTQLAVEFAYRFGYAFEGGIYWIQGTNPSTWLSQFANIAQMLDLKISPNTNPVDRDKQHFIEFKKYCAKYGSKMLFVIDNVTDPLDLDKDDTLFPGDYGLDFRL